MNRRALLAAATTAGIAGCVGTPKSNTNTPVKNPESGNVNAASKIDLSEYTWKHEIPGEDMVVSEGRVFGQEVNSRSIQNESEWEISGGVFSLNARTGDHQWTYGSSHAGMSGFRTPIVTDAVYVNKVNDVATWPIAIEFNGTERWAGSESPSETEDVFSGQLLDATYGVAYLSGINAVDAAGDVLWSYPGTSVQFDSTAGERPETAYSAGEEVVALDTADGSVRWRYEHEPERSVVHAVSDGVAYVTADRESIIAVVDGNALWRQDSLSRMAVLGFESDTLLVSDASQVYAFDGRTGEKQWARKMEGDIQIHNNRVYAAKTGSIGQPSTVSAFALDDGAEIWRIEVGDAEEYEHLSMEISGNDRGVAEQSLFVQIENRKLHRINSEGEVTHTLTPENALHDVAVDDHILISTDSGIYALDSL